MEYKRELKWVEGKSNQIADTFSRYPVSSPQDSHQIVAIITVEDADFKKFTEKCLEDVSYKDLLFAVQAKTEKDFK